MLNLFGQQIRQISLSAAKGLRRGLLMLSPMEETAPKINVSKAIEGWDEKLRQSGVGDAEFNLKCIVAKVLQRKFNTLTTYENENFTPNQVEEFQRLCQARCARVPLQHIVGEWDFMNITLKTAPQYLYPRPETEEFVSKVIDVYRNETNPIDMLEVGCGSGAMSLAILNALPNINSTAVERSKIATALAAENAKMLNLHDRFVVFNHTTAKDNYLPIELKGRRFDLIISNPPYVKSTEFHMLQPEVKLYENVYALVGGQDGLQIARLVFDCACYHLKSGAKLWMELGEDHPPLVKTIINLKYKKHLRFVESFKDQYNRERFVEIERL